MGKIIVHNLSTLNDAAALQIVQVYMQAMNDPGTMGAFYATMRSRYGVKVLKQREDCRTDTKTYKVLDDDTIRRETDE